VLVDLGLQNVGVEVDQSMTEDYYEPARKLTSGMDGIEMVTTKAIRVESITISLCDALLRSALRKYDLPATNPE